MQVNAFCDGAVLEIHGLGDRPTSYITSSNIVYFGVDTNSPAIEVTSIGSKTYITTDVPLIFTISEPSSQVTYSLDGKENVTITGNTTISGLSVGLHNVTAYAKDELGNTGTSETITFSIAEPFPVVPVAAASVATIAVVVIGLLVYFKKRKH